MVDPVSDEVSLRLSGEDKVGDKRSPRMPSTQTLAFFIQSWTLTPQSNLWENLSYILQFVISIVTPGWCSAHMKPNE